MIYQLEKQSFNLISPLLATGVQFPEVLSIVEGNNPGWIFVDSVVSPNTAYALYSFPLPRRT